MVHTLRAWACYSPPSWRWAADTQLPQDGVEIQQGFTSRHCTECRPQQALSTVVPLLSAAAGPSSLASPSCSQKAVCPLSRLGQVTQDRRSCVSRAFLLDLSGFPSLCSLRPVPAVVTLTFLTGPFLLMASDSASIC